jgi:hypothetical protein
MGNVARMPGHVQMDPTTSVRLRPFTKLETSTDIYPPLVERDAFVLLGTSNVQTSTAPAATATDQIAYHYPLAFLDATKDLLYSNGGARVYR